MLISSDELVAQGFWRAGTVYSDPATTLRVEMTRDAHGFVVYLMVVNGAVMKAGKTETPLKTRMKSTFASLRKKMTKHADHPRFQERTFKEQAQATIRAGHEVEIWAREFPSAAEMLAAEDALNRHYRGLWTKEGKGRA
jgi:hypothetical protein